MMYSKKRTLLTSNQYSVDEEIAKATADAVWNTSRNIRDSIRIAKITKTVEDVHWLATTFLDPLGIQICGQDN
jgi:hypothetical protein